MKKQITILALIFATLFANAQSIIAPDTINTNTVWADTIYLNSDVYIENGVQLKIKPGATVIANGWYGIDCQGQLLAQGTELDSILFTVIDTTNFYDLTKVLGGWRGINFDNTPSTNDSSIINFCIIEYGKACDVANGTKLKGGAIYSYFFSKLKITNSNIRYNHSYSDGGAIYLMVSSVNILNNIIEHSRSLTQGGGIAVIGTSVVLIRDNIFRNNIAGTKEGWFPYPDGFLYQGDGAAICISISGTDINTNRTKVISNSFFNNSARSIFYESSIHTLFANNILCNNRGSAISNGGGPFSHCIYLNNTISKNNPVNSTIILMNSTLFYNNIVSENLSDNHNYDSLIIVHTGNSTPNYGTHCNIKYNYLQQETPTDGAGNIYGSAPQFINPSPDSSFVSNWQDYDWRLQPTSPCINAGIIDTTGLELPEEDAFGNPRIFGNRIDIGAYENQTEVWNNVFSLEKNMQITYYPNPVQNSLNIKIESKELINKNLEIYDINGKLLKTMQISNNTITIDVSDLETGVYYLRLGGLSKEFIKY